MSSWRQGLWPFLCTLSASSPQYLLKEWLKGPVAAEILKRNKRFLTFEEFYCNRKTSTCNTSVNKIKKNRGTSKCSSQENWGTIFDSGNQERPLFCPPSQDRRASTDSTKVEVLVRTILKITRWHQTHTHLDHRNAEVAIDESCGSSGFHRAQLQGQRESQSWSSPTALLCSMWHLMSFLHKFPSCVPLFRL